MGGKSSSAGKYLVCKGFQHPNGYHDGPGGPDAEDSREETASVRAGGGEVAAGNLRADTATVLRHTTPGMTRRCG